MPNDSWLPSVPKRFLAVLGVLAGVTYGILWLIYMQFYGVFNIRPEDVGFDQTRLVSQALIGPAVVIIVASVIGAVYLGLMFLYLGFFKDIGALRPVLHPRRDRAQIAEQVRGRAGSIQSFARGSVREHWWRYLVASVVLSSAVILGVLLVTARNTATEVLNEGQGVSAVALEGRGLSLPLLDFQALPIELSVDDAEQRVGTLDVVDECFLFLGKRDGRLVLFDVRSRGTYFVPSDGLIIELRSGNVPDECTARPGYD